MIKSCVKCTSFTSGTRQGYCSKKNKLVDVPTAVTCCEDFTPKKLASCDWCKHADYNEDYQYNWCKVREQWTNWPQWGAENCNHYELDSRLKMTDKTYGDLSGFDHHNHVGIAAEPAHGGEYLNINWVTESAKIDELNMPTLGDKIDAGFIHTSVGEWNTDPPDIIIEGDVYIKGKVKMVAVEDKIQDKQEKINKIIEARKNYIKNWCSRFKEIDWEIRSNYLFKYSRMHKEFRKYILQQVGKKQAKKLSKPLKYLFLRDSTEILYGKHYSNIEKVELFSGEKFNFIKKVLAVVSKYATKYANERLKVKYSNLTSKFDALMYDDESSICESCGSENQIIAIYCNTCGKKLD